MDVHSYKNCWKAFKNISPLFIVLLFFFLLGGGLEATSLTASVKKKDRTDVSAPGKKKKELTPKINDVTRDSGGGGGGENDAVKTERERERLEVDGEREMKRRDAGPLPYLLIFV